MRPAFALALAATLVAGVAIGFAASTLAPKAPSSVANSPTAGALPSATIPTAVPPSPGPSFVNPTPTETLPPFNPIPLVLGSDDAAGTIAFHDRSGSWVYDGHSGTLGVLDRAGAPAVSRYVLGVAAPFTDFAPAYDTRTRSFPRLLPAETAAFTAFDVSADSLRVAYLTPDRKLRIAFQQQFHNVDGRALAADRIFSWPLRLSPSGGSIALTGTSQHDRDPSRSFARSDGLGLDLWLVDVASGGAKQVMCSSDPCPAGLKATGVSVNVLSWSPDERYLLLRTPSVAAGIDYEGTEHYVIDLVSGELTKLGPAVDLFSWRTWAAPHTLYLAGGKVSGQPGTPPTRLRQWSPETGINDLTPVDRAIVSPSYDSLGQRVLYVEDVPGTPRRIASFDTRTGLTRVLAADPRYAIDGLRISVDGTALLQLRRELRTGALEIWLSDGQGAVAHPLIRYGTGYSQTTDAPALSLRALNLDSIAWSR